MVAVRTVVDRVSRAVVLAVMPAILRVGRERSLSRGRRLGCVRRYASAALALYGTAISVKSL
jgi:hypothetical protein